MYLAKNLVVKQHAFRYELLLLNGIAVIIYYLVYLTFPLGVSEEVMFSSVDAGTYRDVGSWLLGGESTQFSEIRPFGYPLFLKLSYALGGTTLVWILQFLMWLITINLVFLTSTALTGKKYIPWVSAVLVLMNFSLMALTLHAITEVMSAMLLAGFIYFIARFHQQRRKLFFIHSILFGLSLMVIVKPVFSIPLYITLFVILPLAYWRAYLREPIKLLLIPCMLLPFLIQVGIMKMNHNTFKVSLISENTFAAYFLAQGIERIEQSNWEAAQQKATSLNKEEQKGYLLGHAGYYVSYFVQNVQDNIKGAPIFLTYPENYEKQGAGPYMELLNKTVLLVHYIMFGLMATLMVVFVRKRKWNQCFILFVLSGITAYYLLTTGVSFWQGDRLVISVLPVWAVLYPWLMAEGVGRIFSAREIK